MVIRRHYSEFHLLLSDLNLKRDDARSSFPFEQALSKSNKGTAMAEINSNTILIDHLLPYDCSFVSGEESRLDKILAAYSTKTDVLVFLLDSVSSAYAFSVFEGGTRNRRWFADHNNILCDEGENLAAEIPFITGNADNLNQYSSSPEARVITVFESFVQNEFNKLVADTTTLFHLFI